MHKQNRLLARLPVLLRSDSQMQELGYTAVTPVVDIEEVTNPVFGDFVIGESVRGVSSGTSAIVAFLGSR